MISTGKLLYPCAYCGQKHDSKTARMYHEKDDHADEDGNALEISCDLCTESLPSADEFRKHVRIVHKKKSYVKQEFCEPAICDECGKIFKVLYILK